MFALVTGASSGIGRDISKELAKRGYDIIVVARNKEKLNDIKKQIEKKYKVKVFVEVCDVSIKENCKNLYEKVMKKYGKVEVLVNNAGFGTCGQFTETDLDKELQMIDTNVTAYHILTKLFLKEMVKRDKGYILNVASISGFMPGPLMATYYSSKAYIVRLTQAIRQELVMQGSNVTISALCPGPVKTNFNNVADVKFNIPGKSSEYVAKYAVKKMFRNKILIFPGFFIWTSRLLAKILPDQLMAFFCYFMQKRKIQ